MTAVNCQLANFDWDAGNGTFIDCTISGTPFKCATARYDNCRIAGNSVVLGTASQAFRGCSFGFSAHLNPPSAGAFKWDAESEYSFFSNGGILDGDNALFSLTAGLQNAFPIADASYTVDFTAETRLVLPATRLGAARTLTIALTGSEPGQVMTIDSYNGSGNALTVKFGVATLAIIPTGQIRRYRFKVDAAGTAITLDGFEEIQ